MLDAGEDEGLLAAYAVPFPVVREASRGLDSPLSGEGMWSASGPCVAPWGFACRGGRSADGGGSDLMSLHGHPRLPGPRVPIWPGQRRMVLEVLRGAGDGASGTATTTVPRASTPWGSCPPGSECQGRPICVILCQIAGLCSAGKAKGNPEASLPNHYTKPSTTPRSPTPPSHPACLHA